MALSASPDTAGRGSARLQPGARGRAAAQGKSRGFSILLCPVMIAA